MGIYISWIAVLETITSDAKVSRFVKNIKTISENKRNKENKPTCMLCLRLYQVDYFQEILGDKAVSLTSKMNKKARKEAMSKIKSGEVDVVISTYGLFSTGIDVPHLELLLLCAPIRSEIKLRQSAGRLGSSHPLRKA